MRGNCPAAVCSAALLTALPVDEVAAGADDAADTGAEALALLEADAPADAVDGAALVAAADAPVAGAVELVAGADDDALVAVLAVFAPPQAARSDRMPPEVSNAPTRMTWRRLKRDSRGCEVIGDRLPFANTYIVPFIVSLSERRGERPTSFVSASGTRKSR